MLRHCILQWRNEVNALHLIFLAQHNLCTNFAIAGQDKKPMLANTLDLY